MDPHSEFRFAVHGEPQGKARPRFSNGGRVVYTTLKTKSYEETVAWTYRAKRGPVFQGPVAVHILAFFAIPNRSTRAQRSLMLSGELLPTKKPDADNIAKIVLDALNGVAWQDDTQVVSLKVDKQYSQDPRVFIIIEEVSCPWKITE